MTKQALLAAREALEAAEALMIDMGVQSSDAYQEVEHALPLVETALAQPEQEPVATDHELMECLGGQIGASEPHPIYRAPQQVNQMLVEALKMEINLREGGHMKEAPEFVARNSAAALAAVEGK